jgi:outer membrane protein TolC
MNRGCCRACLALALIAAFGAFEPIAASPPGTGDTASPLTLRQALAEALAASPSLQAPDDLRTLAQIHERQAKARLGLKVTPQFQSGSNPGGFNQRTVGIDVSKRLAVGTSVRFSADSYQLGTGTSTRDFRDAGYTIGISQPLFRGWSSVGSADIKQARRSTISAERSYVEARQDLVVEVARSYFSVLQAQRQVEAATRALDRANRLRTSSAARAQVGLATELDVLRADVLASQSEIAVAGQQEVFETSADALRTLLGRPLGNAIELMDADFEALDVAVPGESVEVLVNSALASRLDLQEARDRIADANRNENIARWNLLPPLAVDAAYTRRGLGPRASDLWAPLNGWRFGVSSSYGIDRSDERASAAAASVATRAAERERDNTMRRVTDEIRRAYRASARASATVDIQRRTVMLAERQLRLAELRYESGVAGNFDVVDAENSLFQANSGLITAQADRAVLGLMLRRVSGMLDLERLKP